MNDKELTHAVATMVMEWVKKKDAPPPPGVMNPGTDHLFTYEDAWFNDSESIAYNYLVSEFKPLEEDCCWALQLVKDELTRRNIIIECIIYPHQTHCNLYEFKVTARGVKGKKLGNYMARIEARAILMAALAAVEGE